jgi:hypothetical protein
MSERLRLDKYVAGPNAKFALLSLSSSTSGFMHTQYYAFDTSGHLVDDDYCTGNNEIKSTDLFIKKAKYVVYIDQ